MPLALKRTKTPQQSRSIATVQAILQATIQVLHTHGKARLTTTRISQRAGVSVGTLYQYFPDKTVLLQEALRRHLDTLAAAIEAACNRSHGKSIETVADAIADAWIAAKLSTITASVALYAVVDDIEGRPIAKASSTRIIRVMAQAFRAAPATSILEPELVAQTLLGTLSGVSRDLLDPSVKPAQRLLIAHQLRVLVRAYITAQAPLKRKTRPQSSTAS